MEEISGSTFEPDLDLGSGTEAEAGPEMAGAARRGELGEVGLLGNAVISKIFLRTHKIMVMHSNERGECCLRTLVDRSRSVDAT